MKKNYWLILAALALLGMVLVPTQVHSMQIRAVSRVSTLRLNPVVLPAALPSYPIPGPLAKSGIQMPSRTVPLPAVKEAPSALSQARALQPRDGKAPSAGTINKVFDNTEGSKKEEKGEKKTSPSTRLTLPELDLESEIGIR